MIQKEQQPHIEPYSKDGEVVIMVKELSVTGRNAYIERIYGYYPDYKTASDVLNNQIRKLS